MPSTHDEPVEVPMHDDEIRVTADVARALVASQFPRWRDLPVVPVRSTGTVNAIFRLGDDLVLRLPRVPWGADDIAKESRVLPRLGPELPVAVPVPLAVGEPGDDFPFPWSVSTWLDGRPASPADGGDALADNLARFLNALHGLDAAHAPEGTRRSLAVHDASARAALVALAGTIDADAATRVWDAALAASAWDGAPRWVHGDMLAGNVLVADGRLTAVIDFAGVGTNDPACDLMIAWSALTARARARFRSAVHLDDDAWVRGRGWALLIALWAIPYYTTTNPGFVANARRMVDEVVRDVRSGG